MINSVDVQKFLLLFKGKNNSYVRNEFPTENQSEGKIKTRITQHEGTVDKELLENHLDGDFAVGICPITTEGKCYFAVLDIDCYDKRTEKMLQFITEYDLPLLPFRSKSGGLHVYLFFARSVTAKTAREILARISSTFCLEDIYGKGKVEIFPKQDTLKEGGFGSCVTLPYFNAESTYTYLMDSEGSSVPFKEALDIIKGKMVSCEDLNSKLSSLPFSDAPPCLQRLLLSGLIGSEDSGRNNFLFSYSIYAKKKYGNGFENYVKEVNATFSSPLSDEIVEQICTSVSNNEYYYRCKEIPCSSYCNKSVCKNREFGLGRDKGRFTGIEYGKLTRYLSAEPYYIWELRLHGQAEWKNVLFKDEGFLLDQRNFQKACVRYLNNAPYTVRNDDWFAILNSVLPNIVEVEVKKETDTSSLAQLRLAFNSYLSNKQARRDSPFQIRMGLSVRQEVNGRVKYYFTHQGFTDYLRTQKVNFDYGTLRETLKYFGAEEDTLHYVNALNESRDFPCWSKWEDNELQESFAGAIEVEQGDKSNFMNQSVSEVSVSDVESETDNNDGEKPYSEEDMKKAEEMF